MNVKVKIPPRVIRETLSICPECKKRLSAVIVRRGSDYFLEKTCPEHGSSSTVTWRGENPSYYDWGAGYIPPAWDENIALNCPDNCGLCSGHLQKTCCALVEVTHRCDLHCPVCFANSDHNDTEPTVEELYSQFQQLVKDGATFVQLSGGEPTARDDLTEIVAAAKRAGCVNIQLNSNGIRLGRDKHLARALREAGLSFVFMQFDGTDDEIYNKLRGGSLLTDKIAAINNCADVFLGVTLVPTLVPGINDNNIGEIIDFGLSNSPVVRGIHFQPISYFGRYPHPPENKDRITLPEVLRAIEEQTGGKLNISDFAPSSCDHPYCGFHGDFVVLPNKALMKLTQKKPAPCCGDDAHLKNRNFVARRWNRSEKSEANSDEGEDFTELNAFAKRIKSHGFTITAMVFQDAWNLDIQRLRQCSLHVSERGLSTNSDHKMIPFCAKYLTAAQPSRE